MIIYEDENYEITPERLSELKEICRKNNIARAELSALLQQTLARPERAARFSINLVDTRNGDPLDLDDVLVRTMSSSFELTEDEHSLALQSGLKAVIKNRLQKFGCTQAGYDFFREHPVSSWNDVTEELLLYVCPYVEANHYVVNSTVTVCVYDSIGQSEIKGRWERLGSEGERLGATAYLTPTTGRIRIPETYQQSFVCKAKALEEKGSKDFFHGSNGISLCLH